MPYWSCLLLACLVSVRCCINQGSPEKQKQRDKEIEKEIKIDRDLLWGIDLHSYGRLRLRNLPSASWRPRKIDGVVPVQAWRPKNQGSQWCKSQSESESPGTTSVDVWGQEKMDVPTQAKRTNSPILLFLFYSGPQQIGWWQISLVKLTFIS